MYVKRIGKHLLYLVFISCNEEDKGVYSREMQVPGKIMKNHHKWDQHPSQKPTFCLGR